MAPNYQAGRDAVAGFKAHFKGEVLDEDFVPLTQPDFQADLARIATAKPDGVFAFMSGGLGVNLVKQFRQSGLADSIPFLSAFTVDESTLPAQREAAVGLYGGMSWAPKMDNPANKAFVAAFEAAYKYVPASYAMQAFDAAQLIDSALKRTGGDTQDKDKLRAPLRATDFVSPRGAFRFSNNGYPIQDFYVVQVARWGDGLFEPRFASACSKTSPTVTPRSALPSSGSDALPGAGPQRPTTGCAAVPDRGRAHPCFGVMDVIDLAHGVQYMLGAYFAVVAQQWTGSFLLALLLATAGLFAIGLLLDRESGRRGPCAVPARRAGGPAR